MASPWGYPDHAQPRLFAAKASRASHASVKIEHLEGRDHAALQLSAIAPAELADPSRKERMLSGKPVPTQDLAEVAIAKGYVGIVAPSYARGAPADAINLVLCD